MLDQQPVGALAAAAVTLHTYQNPTSMQPLAVQCEFQVSGFESLLRRFAVFGRPVSAVPDLNCPSAVLSFGDRALEIAILQGMIFNFDCQALFVEGRARARAATPKI